MNDNKMFNRKTTGLKLSNRQLTRPQMNPKSEDESEGEFRMFSKGSDGFLGAAENRREDTAFDLDVQDGVPSEVNRAYERANKSLRTISAQDKAYRPRFGEKQEAENNGEVLQKEDRTGFTTSLL